MMSNLLSTTNASDCMESAVTTFRTIIVHYSVAQNELLATARQKDRLTCGGIANDDVTKKIYVSVRW